MRSLALTTRHAATRSLTAIALTQTALLLLSCQQPSRSLGRARGPDGGSIDGDDGGTSGVDAATPVKANIYRDPSAPTGAEDAFGGPMGMGAGPEVVYPLPDAMLAANVGGVTVQWRASTQSQIFRIRLEGASEPNLVFAGGGACRQGECLITLPLEMWTSLARAQAGATVTLTVDAVASAGASIFTSAPVTLHFAPAPLIGGLTYWSSQNEGLMRQAFGALPKPYLPTSTGSTQGRCVGCHAVSRDGCLTASSIEISVANRHLAITDPGGADRSAVPGNETVFQAWSPNGRYLLTVLHGKVSVRDKQGVWLDELPLPLFGEGVQALVSHAAWSPDGQFLVFTRLPAGAQTVDPTLYAGDIVKVPFRGVKEYGPAQVLVEHTDTEYHFYPTVSPDGKWVVFSTGNRPGESFFAFTEPNTKNYSSFAQQAAALRLVSAQGGTVVNLARATFAPNSTASWPHFAPTTQNDDKLFFIVFSSKLDYGFELRQSKIEGTHVRSVRGRLQLWIAGIDVSRAGDPSYAPFWLPGQNKGEVNHHGQWSLALPTAAECGF